MQQNESKILEEDCWKTILIDKYSDKFNIKRQSVERKLLKIMTVDKGVTEIDGVEKLAISLGHHIDLDTNIPTLPGNRMLAADLIYVRASEKNKDIGFDDVSSYIPTVIELAGLIIDDPGNISFYQDEAPFDCLRPPK